MSKTHIQYLEEAKELIPENFNPDSSKIKFSKTMTAKEWNDSKYIKDPNTYVHRGDKFSWAKVVEDKKTIFIKLKD